VSDGVKVTGDFGAVPKVTIDAPLSTDTTQRTVAIEGDGAQAVEGNYVGVNYSLYSGSTGDTITESTYDASSLQLVGLTENLIVGFSKTIECSTVGSRVVGTIATADGYSADILSSAGLAEDETIVLVADIVSVVDPLERAAGEAQDPVAGFPTAVLDTDGVPTVTIPDADPPTETKVETLIKGEGAVVGTGANVVVNYQGIIWGSGTVFNDSWASGSTAAFNTGAVVTGFKTALEGQTVGSQVMVIVPPADGYGDAGSEAAGIAGTDTLVFIIDILGVG
jgi:peptidylprolyl isomerase